MIHHFVRWDLEYLLSVFNNDLVEDLFHEIFNLNVLILLMFLRQSVDQMGREHNIFI